MKFFYCQKEVRKMTAYNIYYSDGNHRILIAEDMFNLMKYLMNETTYDNNNIIKIELRGWQTINNMI